MSPQDPIHSLLQRTSRSFALSIPTAPAPIDHEMSVGYLLFRIADTFEDTTEVPVPERVAGLGAFARAVMAPQDAGARAELRRHAEALPLEHEGYHDLMRATDLVLDALQGLRPGAADIIAQHACRTALGCIPWIEQTNAAGVMRLHSMSDLRAYCYTVAGIPGEMLCSLFLLGRPELGSVECELRQRARVFGEAMQLVNILKDSELDASEERVFIPAGVTVKEALALARHDLAVAQEYVALLRQPGVDPGVVAFHAITCDLARVALDVTEAQGPGAKVPRKTVAKVLESAGVAHQHVLS